MSATLPERPAAGPVPRPARDHCLAPGRAADAPAGTSAYGRLFPDLPPLRDGAEVFGREGRRAVAGDDSPFVAPDRPAADPATDAQGPAGWPVFAQFVAHDLTADRSALATRAEVADLRNVRAPRLNLECVYGRGPADQPYLYTRDDPAKLLAGPGDDVPRNPEGVALIADPRNDVHRPIAQLHLAFLRVHARLVDRLRADGTPEAALFDEARRALRWHFQWVLLHDFLPTLVGPELAARVRDGGREHFLPEGGEAFVPVEFADAAFRYGHSQVRERYALNAAMEPLRLFPDLLGFRPVPPEHVVDWALLFDLPGRPPAPQRAKRIDGRLVPSLIRLPAEVTGDLAAVEHRSLAVRDLQRGTAVGLPSGEAVARHLGIEPLTAEEVGVREVGWTWETPLWFYVLKEAEVLTGGERLGPVGGTIVAEVVCGVVDLDPTSFRAVDPAWRPTLPAAGSSFTLADLLVASTATG